MIKTYRINSTFSEESFVGNFRVSRSDGAIIGYYVSKVDCLEAIETDKLMLEVMESYNE